MSKFFNCANSTIQTHESHTESNYYFLVTLTTNAVVACIKTLCQHSLGVTEENYKIINYQN